MDLIEACRRTVQKLRYRHQYDLWRPSHQTSGTATGVSTPSHKKLRASLAVCSAASIALLSACSATTSQAPAVSESAAGGGSSVAASATASGWNVPVDWSKGKSVQGMEDGIPNPPGWYEAAFGPRTKDKILYLTYDDGPSTTTPPLLSMLAQYDAKATFFVLGKQVEEYPSYLKSVLAAGHAIGNHTMNHDDLIEIPSEKVRAELEGVREVVGPALGNCMRPPYGSIDTRVAVISEQLDLMPILWTGHAQDWDPPPTERMIEMLKEATSPGAVLLLHDSASKQQVLEATKVMLPWWKDQGYRLETVPACRK